MGSSTQYLLILIQKLKKTEISKVQKMRKRHGRSGFVQEIPLSRVIELHLRVGARRTTQQRRGGIVEICIEEGAHVSACDLQPTLTVDGAEQPEGAQTQRQGMDGVI